MIHLGVGVAQKLFDNETWPFIQDYNVQNTVSLVNVLSSHHRLRQTYHIQ